MKKTKKFMTKLMAAAIAAAVAVTTVPVGNVDAYANHYEGESIYRNKKRGEWMDSNMMTCATIDSINDTSIKVKSNTVLGNLEFWNTGGIDNWSKPKGLYVEVYKGNRAESRSFLDDWDLGLLDDPVLTVKSKNYKSVTVKGLKPNTKYTLVVRGYKKKGKKMVFSNNEDCFNIKTRKQGKGPVKPGAVNITDINSTVMDINYVYKSSPEIYKEAYLADLTVYYNKPKKADGIRMRIYKGNTLVYELTYHSGNSNRQWFGVPNCLELETEYTVKVRAYQKTGKKIKYGKEATATITTPGKPVPVTI